MSRDLRQLALASAVLGILALIGTIVPTRPDQTPPTSPDQVQRTLAMTPEAPSDAPAVTEAVVRATTSTTELPPPPAPPRTVELVVHPQSESVAITATDSSGHEVAGAAEVAAELSGEVDVTVSAEGYRSERLVIPADMAGRVEIFLDPPDQVVDKQRIFQTGGAPKQVAFTPDAAELWVTLLSGAGVEVYDPVSGSLLEAIDLPEAGSVEVIFNQTGSTAYVSQMETARVYEIDVATHAITRTLETGGSWTKVVLLSPDESRLWASNWVSNDISEFDLATGEMVRRMPTVRTPRGLALDPTGNRLYVAGFDDGDIEVIDLETGESTNIFHSGGALRHLVADPGGATIYASDMAKDTVYAIDTETDTVTPRAITDRLPNTIDLSSDGLILAVSNRGANNPETYYLPGPQWGSVLLLNSQTGEILDALVGGNQPTGLDLSADGRWLAYSDFLDNRVTVVALPTSKALLESGGGRAESYRDELQK